MVALESWLRTRLLPSRHTTYFEVLDALSLPGCPICRLALRAADRYLDLLSYEAVNDSGVRGRLRASRGFCNHHTWQFTGEVRNAAGRAMIYRDILGVLERPLAAPELRRLATGQEGAQALAERLLPAGSCPVCRTMERSRHRYLETLVLHLGTPEMRERYQSSAGLCLPHLAQALRSTAQAADVDLLLSVAARQVGQWRVADRYGVRGFTTAIVAAIVGRAGAFPGAPPEIAAPVTGPAAEGGGPAGLGDPAGRGCPVCAAARAAVTAHLAQLPRTVCALGPDDHPAAALALCNAHAWQGLELVSPGMAARLWQPAARAVRRALEQACAVPREVSTQRGLLSWGERPGAGVAAVLSVARPCSACSTQAAAERQAALALLARAASGLDGLPALCVPHFALALRLGANAQQRPALLGQQAAAVAGLRQDLAEYIRKQNFRVREAPGPEADSPWRAVAQVAGARGLAAGPLGWVRRGGSPDPAC